MAPLPATETRAFVRDNTPRRMMGHVLDHDRDRKGLLGTERSFSIRCAYHEAGHAIAAFNFGIPVITVSVVGNRPHLHRARWSTSSGIGVEAMTILCVASPIAEEMFIGSVNDGRFDYEMARDILLRVILVVR
jgi:hypothetical protein